MLFTMNGHLSLCLVVVIFWRAKEKITSVEKWCTYNVLTCIEMRQQPYDDCMPLIKYNPGCTLCICE